MANTNWRTGMTRVKGLPVTTQLIIINSVVFVVLNIFLNLTPFNLTGYLAMPAQPASLATRFYTPFTYMFTHLGLGHIFFNMLYLYFTGQIFGTTVGGKRLWFTYLGGGLAGAALFFILSYFFFPDTGPMIGASAAVTAVAISCAVYAPNLPVTLPLLGTFALKWVVGVFFIINTLIDLSLNTGGKVSHLGGAIFGLLYALQLKKGNDWMNIFNFKRRRAAKIIKMQTAQRKIDNEEKVLNEILDKINRSGYDSLSRSEKETLQRISSKK